MHLKLAGSLTMRLDKINSNHSSYQQLINFHEENKDKFAEEVCLSLQGFFAANMSAALGALLDLLSLNLNQVRLEVVTPDIKRILLKNNFLSYYGYQKVQDQNRTTIKYLKLEPADGRFFKNYVIEELMHRSELPSMSKQLQDKIVEVIYEIFVNAQMHSQTNAIYTCGQFYPNKNKIEFTLVDTGIGFMRKINERFKSSFTAEAAIAWAVRDRHTTKEGVTGGIGLALLTEFIANNKGRMQIISDSGFYEFA